MLRVKGNRFDRRHGRLVPLACCVERKVDKGSDGNDAGRHVQVPGEFGWSVRISEYDNIGLQRLVLLFRNRTQRRIDCNESAREKRDRERDSDEGRHRPAPTSEHLGDRVSEESHGTSLRPRIGQHPR